MPSNEFFIFEWDGEIWRLRYLYMMTKIDSESNKFIDSTEINNDNENFFRGFRVGAYFSIVPTKSNFSSKDRLIQEFPKQ